MPIMAISPGRVIGTVFWFNIDEESMMRILQALRRLSSCNVQELHSFRVVLVKLLHMHIYMYTGFSCPVNSLYMDVGIVFI